MTFCTRVLTEYIKNHFVQHITVQNWSLSQVTNAKTNL